MTEVKPRRRRNLFLFTIAATLVCIAGTFVWSYLEEQASIFQASKLHMPPGFKLEVWAEVPGARSLCLGDKGTVFVGTRDNPGDVFAVTSGANNQRKVTKIASGLMMPNGVAMRKGALYVGEVFRVLRFDDIENKLESPPQPVVVNDTFPHDTHHGWKYLAFGPDDLLYVPIGAPCNVCIKEDPRFAGIMRMKPDGTKLEQFANGIRNTVGFDWDPNSKEMWFTDNGRDWLGDNLPPDELNHAPKPGLHFGFPFRYGQNVVDPDYGKKAPTGVQFTPPAQDLDPHVASLGMKFYTGKMFPPEYRNQIFIAEHGSWNRASKIGYRVCCVKLKDGKPVEYKPFIDGWLDGSLVYGRPVDLLNMPDGSMLISDDKAGLIYRVTYNG